MSITFTAKEVQVLTALIDAYEQEHNGWGTVYLDNAAHGLSEASFAGVCGSLAKKGVYEEEADSNGCFGAVKMDALAGLDVTEEQAEQQTKLSLDANDYTVEQRAVYIAEAEQQGWTRSKARRAWRAVHGSMYK